MFSEHRRRIKKQEKMNECIIIVDNSNVWIEGKKFSAKIKGVKPLQNGKHIDDPSWRIDFGKLLTVVAGEQKIREAILVGSRPPLSDTIWKAAKEKGFKVIVHNRNSMGKEKAVDTEIVAQGTEIICTSNAATLKLLSGDRDFIPFIHIATKRGWETEMWAFTNAFQGNGEMAQTVTHIQPLDNVFSEIGWNEFDWPSED